MTRRAALFLVLLTLLGSAAQAAENRGRGDKGEALIFSEGTDRLVVTLDSFTDGADHLVDRWFVLQTREAVAPLRVHLRVAEVRYRDGLLRVISEQERVVYEFAVGGRGRGETLEGFELRRTEGYGLSEHAGDTDVSEVLAEAWSETGGDDCNAGGEGATSGSYSNRRHSSSISCDRVAYACCRETPAGVSCRCIVY